MDTSHPFGTNMFPLDIAPLQSSDTSKRPLFGTIYTFETGNNMDAYRPLPFTLANPATPTGLKIAPVPYAGAPVWKDYVFNPNLTTPVSPTDSFGSVSSSTISPGMLPGFEIEGFHELDADEGDTKPVLDLLRSPTPYVPEPYVEDTFTIKTEVESPLTPAPALIPTRRDSPVSPVTALISSMVDMPADSDHESESETQGTGSVFSPSTATISKPKTSSTRGIKCAKQSPKRESMRAGERRMSQNRSAQKKYREKNKTLAKIRADFNRDTLVLIKQVTRDRITPQQLTQRLAKLAYHFVRDMKDTCATTGALVQQEVEEALGK